MWGVVYDVLKPGGETLVVSEEIHKELRAYGIWEWDIGVRLLIVALKETALAEPLRATLNRS